jgi:hypothetical protein
MTPGILGGYVNILGDLGFLAVQVRNSRFFNSWFFLELL